MPRYPRATGTVGYLGMKPAAVVTRTCPGPCLLHWAAYTTKKAPIRSGAEDSTRPQCIVEGSRRLQCSEGWLSDKAHENCHDDDCCKNPEEAHEPGIDATRVDYELPAPPALCPSNKFHLISPRLRLSACGPVETKGPAHAPGQMRGRSRYLLPQPQATAYRAVIIASTLF